MTGGDGAAAHRGISGRTTEPLDIDAYLRAGGYAAVRKALGGMTPEEVINEVTASNLRGRGGAGFPTGQKWSLVPDRRRCAPRKYLVVNADEMEPGTFKDRLLMEGDPHQLIEGTIVSAFAIQASVAYIFLRWPNTRLPAARLQRAIDEARAKGYLGKNILGSGFDLELHLHRSAGRYICGDETAMLTALEGKRAIPRAKPPYPADQRALGQAHRRQQRRDACQRAAHRQSRRRLVPQVWRTAKTAAPRSTAPAAA